MLTKSVFSGFSIRAITLRVTGFANKKIKETERVTDLT